MDMLEKRSIEITSLAMNGLAARHKAVSSNIANANSENYKKIEVNFENQLKKIIVTEDRKEQHMLSNMYKENKAPLQAAMHDLSYSGFSPEAVSTGEGIGNNVNLEGEMSDLAKTGIQYNALAMLQQKAFKGLQNVIQQGGRY